MSGHASRPALGSPGAKVPRRPGAGGAAQNENWVWNCSAVFCFC